MVRTIRHFETEREAAKAYDLERIKAGKEPVKYSKKESMKTGIERIADERRRQTEKEGWDVHHDSGHQRGELAKAAACYAMPARYRVNQPNGKPNLFPWAKKWWKPAPNIDKAGNYDNAEERIRELEKAGALCAAEIDRILNCYK